MSKFKVVNVENRAKKPKAVLKAWDMLSKIDPGGLLTATDEAIVMVDGGNLPGRTHKALGFDKEMTDIAKNFGVVDGPVADDLATATGVMFTMYQLLEYVYVRGVADGASKELGSAAKKVPAEALVDEEEDEDIAEELESDVDPDAPNGSDPDEDGSLDDDDEEDDDN